MLHMSPDRQWLDLGLDALPAARARRIRAFRLLVATSGAMRGRLDRALAPSGITAQQGAMLQLIESRPEPPTISQVAEAMNMTHQNVKQIAAALERKGFLTITPDPADRRARRLRLTAKHRRFWKQRNPADFANVERWTMALTDDEVVSLVALLARVYAHLRSSDTSDGEDDEDARSEAGAARPRRRGAGG